MGTDLCLIWNDERVAELGRAYHFEEIQDIEQKREKIIRDIVAYAGYTPKDHEELLAIIEEIVDGIQYLCDEFSQYGMIKLLDDLKEQGFETMNDYEWEERDKTKKE